MISLRRLDKLAFVVEKVVLERTKCSIDGVISMINAFFKCLENLIIHITENIAVYNGMRVVV